MATNSFLKPQKETPKAPAASTKPRAIRKVVRNAEGALTIIYIDVNTGQQVSDLSKYDIVGLDGNVEAPGTGGGTTTPALSSGYTNQRRKGGRTSERGIGSFMARPGASKGTGDMFKDIITAGTTLKENIDNAKKAVIDGVLDVTGLTPVKQQVVKWVRDVTGQQGLFPDEPSTMDAKPFSTAATGIAASKNPTPSVSQPISTPSAQFSSTMQSGEVAKNVFWNPDNIGVRKLPPDQTLVTDIAAVFNSVDPTLRVEINSGGQVPIDSASAVPGVNRIPTTTINHDVQSNNTSYAVDVQVFDASGKQQTPSNNPALFQKVGEAGVVAGFTQFGMDGQVVHLGKDPADTEIRTWGYPAGSPLPPSIQQGINNGLEIVKSGKAPELYTNMVAAVSQPTSNAPIPAIRSGAIDAVNTVRSLFDLPKVVSDTVQALGGAVSDTLGSIPAVPPMDDQTTRALSNAGDTGLFNFEGNVARENYIKPAVGDGLAQLRNTVSSGLADGVAAVGDLGNQAIKSTGGFIADLMTPQAPVASQSASALKSNMGFMGTGKDGGASPTVPAPFSLDDAERNRIVTQTILGEAAGEGTEGMQAVANVIKNRALSGDFPIDPKDVALQPKQFSTWNSVTAGGNNPSKWAPGSPEFEQASKIAEMVFSGALPDNTGGSLYYHTPDVSPTWAQGVTGPQGTTQIGNHIFYPTKPVETGNTTAAAMAKPVTAPASDALGFMNTARNATGNSGVTSTSKPATTVNSSGQAMNTSQLNAMQSTAGVKASTGGGTTSATGIGGVASAATTVKKNDGSGGGSTAEKGISNLSKGTSVAGTGSTKPTSGSDFMASTPKTVPKASSAPKATGTVSSAGKTTSGSQKVTTATGSSITKDQKDAMSKL